MMKTFKVINWDFNKDTSKEYDVIPYLVDCYKKNRFEKKPKTFEEFREFVKSTSQYQWWGRCEYEIIITDWPKQKNSEKWDIHRQIMMNLDTITKLVIESL